MATTFRALLATRDGDRQKVAVTELTEPDLMDSEVTVAVEHSTVKLVPERAGDFRDILPDVSEGIGL